MNGAFGFFIKPPKPSSYDVVMDIVRPFLLQDCVHTKDSDSWNFGGWPDRDDRHSIVQSLLEEGISHKTIYLYLTERGSPGSPHRLVLEWMTGQSSSGRKSISAAPFHADFWWTSGAKDDETFVREDYDFDGLVAEIQKREASGRDVPEGFRKALQKLQSDSVASGNDRESK